MNGRKMIYNPVENNIEQNLRKLGSFLSASLPPTWYPKLKPANITPIRLPHVYIELPKTGINNLLTENSKDIVTMPAMKTNIVKIKKENFLGRTEDDDHFFKNNISTDDKYLIRGVLLYSEIFDDI